ncbi:MAG TPA: MmpS family transport accessory protein [Sporichthya sp.]|nr:MmpS family transport accessory protein [Sporichthya sp.]
MTDTLERPASRRARKPVRRRTWIAGAAALLLVIGGSVLLLSRGDDGERFPVVELTPVNHEIRYEVSGTGAAPAITWIVGDRNAEQTALNVPLPWRTTVQLPVGPAGGQANVEVRSPGTGAGSLGCRMFVDGVLVQQQTSTDGFTGVACAAQIPAAYVK